MAIRITVWIQGLFSGFVSIGRYVLGDTESGINRLRCYTSLGLRHRPTTDSHNRRSLVEVCSVPMLLVILVFTYEVTKAKVMQ